MSKKPYRMVTGIGSFPFKKEDDALELIFKYLPLIPHWPQLPAVSTSESFVEQYLYPLIKVEAIKMRKKGSPFFDSEDPEFLNKLTDFYNLYLRAKDKEEEALSNFTMPHHSASGFYAFINRLKNKGTGRAVFLKGQISGPVTLGLWLTDGKRQPAFYQEQLRDILVKTLQLQLEWQIKELKQFGLPTIIFIDEPSLCLFGQAPYVGLSRDEIKESLAMLIETIHLQGAMAGVHACSGIDWAILTELEVDIINFDAFNYFESLLVYNDSLIEFYKKGGIIAWGIVPTDDQSLEESRDNIIKRLDKYFNNLIKKGFSEDLIKKQLMITPSCGSGTLSKELTEKIHCLTWELQSYLNNGNL